MKKFSLALLVASGVIVLAVLSRRGRMLPHADGGPSAHATPAAPAMSVPPPCTTHAPAANGNVPMADGGYHHLLGNADMIAGLSVYIHSDTGDRVYIMKNNHDALHNFIVVVPGSGPVKK